MSTSETEKRDGVREDFELIVSGKGEAKRSPVERHSEETEQVVGDIRRAVRRQRPAEEKVRIVIAGLRGEESIAELCRKEGINQNLYYRWSKEFADRTCEMNEYGLDPNFADAARAVTSPTR